MLLWIESHQELGRHPKTKKLARLLGITLPAAVGHLQFLWWWALDYAKDGNLSEFDSMDIADAAMWEGDPERFLSVLVDVGFVDAYGNDEAKRFHIHDWMDYAGRLVEKRAQNAERMRRSRERHRNVHTENAHESVTLRERNAHESVTLRERNAQVAGLPNQTQHNQTKTLSGGESARAREEISLELNRLLGKSPNPMQVELMAAYSEPGIGMDVELVKRAIRVAALKNKDLNYATAILKKQHERGIQTVAQAEADDASRQAAIASRANEKTPRGTNRTRDKPVDPDPRYANFYALFPEEAK